MRATEMRATAMNAAMQTTERRRVTGGVVPSVASPNSWAGRATGLPTGGVPL